MRVGLPLPAKHKRFLNSNGGRFACDQQKAPSIDEQIFCVWQVCSNTKQKNLVALYDVWI